MTQLKINNPAARLFQLMQRVPSASGNVAFEGWATVLECSGNDQGVVLLRFSQLLELKQRSAACLKAHCSKPELYLRPYARLDEMLRPNRFPESWQTVRALLDGSTLGMLEVGADQLEGVQIEPIWDANEAKAILAEIQGLIKDVQEAEIPIPLRDVLIEHLEAMHRAISAYLILGPTGISSAISQSIGMLVLQYGQIKPVEDSPLLRRFTDIIGQLGKLLNVTIKALEAGKRIKELVK